MKKILNAIVLLFLTTTLFAQPEVKLIESIIGELKKQTLQVSFSILYTNPQNKNNDIQYGTCIIKGDKFHLSMSGIDTYYDGKTQWVYMASDNEVTITTPNKDEIKEISPIAMLEYYSHTHRISRDTEHRTNDNTYINLFPTDVQSEHFKIAMTIDKSNNPQQFIIYQKNGDKITFNWDTIKTINTQPNSTFTFDSKGFPNVYINDMR